MANILQQVQTYQRSGLAQLTNQNCFIGTANTKFKNFDEIVANLGSTVTFDLPTRYSVTNSLVAVFQDTEDRVETLTVNKEASVSYAFTNQEFIFNAERFMDKYGIGAVAELGAEVEADVATTCLSPYRFFGDGVTALNSYGQLSKALAFYRNYGAPKTDTIGYLSDIAVSDIVNSGLNQFVPGRNEKIANTWMVGDYDKTTWCRSNFLPTHIAGTAGENADTLTFVSINAAGDTITFSGVSVDAGAIKENDLLEFETDIRYLTFIGHKPSENRVQVRATADADAIAGTVIISITPALIATPGDRDQNLTRALAVSDTAKVLPSHRRGMIVAGKALYLALPKLADQHPFDTGNEIDPTTGVSLRMYYGSVFGQNQQGFVNDVIWGKRVVPEYAFALIFPL